MDDWSLITGGEQYDELLAALADGPLTLSELAERLDSGALARAATEAGMPLARYIDDFAVRTDATWEVGKRLYRTDHLLDGRAFGHVLTAAEIETGRIEQRPDLAVIDFGSEGRLATAEGGKLVVDYDGDHPQPQLREALVGPPGWLDGFAPGDLVTLTRRGTAVTLTRNQPTGPGQAEVAALAAEFARRQTLPEAGVTTFPMLLDLLAAGQRLFREPLRPIVELLAECGLVARGDYIGPADHPWEAPGIVWDRKRRERLVERWQLESCCREAFERAIDTWRIHLGGAGEFPPPTAVARDLAHGAVAPAFSEYVLRNEGQLAKELSTFTDRLLEVEGRRDAAPVHFLRALSAEVAGDAIRAESELLSALRADPDYLFAAAELADYAADRGDGLRALRLLRQAGAPADSSMVHHLASLFERSVDTGRNEPCPCGSGRKYKACCLRDPNLSEYERVHWLTYRLTTFATRPHRTGHRLDLAAAAAASYMDTDDVVELSDDPMLLDLVAFDPDTLLEYLDERGPLLSQEETDLVRLWSLVPLTLWEVTAYDEGRAITLRDTKTGDVEEVADVAGEPTIEVGMYLLVRVLPAFGRSWLGTEPLIIDDDLRAGLIDLLGHSPSTEDFARWYASVTFQPAVEVPPETAEGRGPD